MQEREYYNSQFEKSVALENQLKSTVRLYKALGGGNSRTLKNTYFV